MPVKGKKKDAPAASAAASGSRKRKAPAQGSEEQAPAAAADTAAARVDDSANAKKKRASKGAAGSAEADKPAYYLVKSEPQEFSIDDLEARPHQTEPWTGVRNAQARNFMRGMKVGDQAFFYHSSCKVPGIVGIAKVVREAYPDHTSWDANGDYFDPKSTPDAPKWFMVDWQLVRRTARQVTLAELKGHSSGALEGMALFTRPRLSVQPVTQQQWEFILGLEQQELGAP